MLEPSLLESLRQHCAQPLEHPEPESLQAFLEHLNRWALNDFVYLPSRSVGQSASRPFLEILLREPIPNQGEPLLEILQQFQEKIAPYAIRPQHPRFLAFIPGAPTFVAVLGDWLAAVSNFFCGVWLEASGPAQIEILVLDWFKELLGYPAEAQGILTSGGSEANLLALVVARERLAYSDRERAVLYLSEQRHWSVDRAARIMGLRPEQLHPLGYRLEAAALENAIEDDRRAGKLPWAVVASAGTTNTGFVDPLDELAACCRRQGLWLHVDAAYGWPAVLVEPGKVLLRGIADADSITLDPHKWFAQTFDVGCVLVRDGGLLARTFAMRPEYMQDVVPAADEINFADHGLALTRRFRALKIWLSLKVLGLDWFRGLVQHCLTLAQYAELLLVRTGRFVIVTPPHLSILCFRHVPPGASDEEADRVNLALCDQLRATGRAFLSTTRVEGRVALRMCFVNWRTTAADVEEIVLLLAGTLRKD